MLNESVMKSLPLVAAVLGDKYGIEVSIGGSEVSTNGRVIKLPSLPINSDDNLVELARGYIDHESAHVRETDFVAIKNANLTALERHIMNSIEDWRVENKLAEIFPGCRGNFKWLIRHFFAADYKGKDKSVQSLIPNWVLLTVRAWDEPSVIPPRDKVESLIEVDFPGLIASLKIVLQDAKEHCSSTVESIAYARDIVEIFQNEKTRLSAQLPHSSVDQNDSNRSEKCAPDGVVEEGENNLKSHENLACLLDVTENDLPKTFGAVLSEKLVASIKQNSKESYSIKIAPVGTKTFTSFPSEDQPEIQRAESALKVRIRSFLQAHQIKNDSYGRRGRLDSYRLSKMVTGDPKIFRSCRRKEGLNTAVHILMDCSGSMRRKMQLTAKVCGALAKALESTEGINVGVTAFPAKTHDGNCDEWNGVCPIVAHGGPVRSEFSIMSKGGTPMGEAIWWVLQQMILLKESRKIVLVLTDGMPDCRANVEASMQAGRAVGVEFYGVGVDFSSISTLFPNACSSVTCLENLSPAIFELLKNVLINKMCWR